MNIETKKVIAFILKIISEKPRFFFWIVIRIISAILPMVTIFQFSEVIRLVENKAPFSIISITIVQLLVVRFADNLLRLLSTTKLDHVISNIGFDIHNYFLSDLHTQTKEERHASVQAIRNFADASVLTLSLFKQPGIDSLVSLLSIPLILYTQNFSAFILTIVYMLVYFFIDLYTTQKYAHLKDILNTKTESYYGKLQDSNDFDLEQRAWTRHYSRLSHWAFSEWSYLQNASAIFYTLILFYFVYLVTLGQVGLSELILIMGYVSQVQPNLNAYSQIKDSLTDTMVGLQHLAKNENVSVLDLDDLI